MNPPVIEIDHNEIPGNTSRAFKALNDLYYDRPGFFTYMFNTHKYRQWERNVSDVCCAVRDAIDMQYVTEWRPLMQVLRLLESAVSVGEDD